jgi:hypothetical protein
LKSIVEDNDIKDEDYVAVFEDDVAFPDSEIFHKTFEEGILYLKNFKMLYLGCGICTVEEQGEIVNDQIIEIKHNLIFCAHAIIYQKSILKEIVDEYRKNLLEFFILPAHFRTPRPGPAPTWVEMYDTFLPTYLRKNKIPVYSFYPPLAIQKSLTGSYDFPDMTGDIDCKIPQYKLRKIDGYEKLKTYEEVWN